MGTQTFKPFERLKSNYVIDYVFNDHVLPLLSGNAVKVLLTVMRWTPDAGVSWADLSYPDLQKLTGIGSRSTISRSLKELLDLGILLKIDPAMNWDKNRYAINHDFEVEIPSPETVLPPSPETVPPDNIYNNRSNNKGSNIINAGNNNKIKEEKEREKKKKKVKPAKNTLTEEDIWNLLPVQLVKCDEFKEAWADWMEWRAEDGFNLTRHKRAVTGQIKLLEQYPVPVVVEMVKRAIRSEWKGLHPLEEWDPVVLANQTTQEKPLADAGNVQMEALKSA